MMVELLQPTPDDIICDPACGTAGFLVSASEYIRRNYEDTMTSEQWEPIFPQVHFPALIQTARCCVFLP